MHLRNADNPILKRIPEIVDSIKSQRLTPGSCFVVVQGDIAFSGAAHEYALAQSFFSELLSRLGQEFPGVSPQIIFVPGNHDCNFTEESDIRKAGLSPARVSELDVAGGFAREFLAVQQNYFEFVARFGQTHKTQRDRLHLRKAFVISSDKTIAFSCVNTAWMSTNPEVYGRLFYPNQLHTPAKDLTADVEIVVAHHPPHWLEPDNGHAFRDQIDKKADIVLTGHEHRHELVTRVGAAFNVEYLAGKAAYDPRAAENGFNLVTIVLEDRQWTVTPLLWTGSRYEDTQGSQTRPFLRNKALTDEGFENNSDFLDELTDVGTGFTHSKKYLRLADVFVYPHIFD
jgi:3',5'-cyclic AMP phosphodiesterase CpdA